MNFSSMQDLLDHLTAWRVPGNAGLIYLNGKEVFTGTSGYADLENKTPMTLDHMLNLYSCSKITTVTAALQLYERGLFLLDDPLYEYIPEYKEMLVKTPDGPVAAPGPITMRHLFTMTAGFNYSSQVPAFQRARELTDGKMDTLTVAKCLASEPLDFAPGAHFQYSLCHDVLAAAVETISGQKFRDYVKEHIFDPLDMTTCVYHNESVRHRMAQQYRYVNSKETDIVKLQSGTINTAAGRLEKMTLDATLVYGPEYDSGGAGITASPRDYVKLGAALANGGKGLTGQRILSAGTVELLKADQLNDTQRVELAKRWAHLYGYGYGLGVRTVVDRAKAGYNGIYDEFGWGGAAGASLFIDTKNNLAMFYGQHMLNPQEGYYQPRVRNVLYKCITG